MWFWRSARVSTIALPTRRANSVPVRKSFTSISIRRRFRKRLTADVPIVGPVDSVLSDMLELLDEARKEGGEVDKAALAQWWKKIDGWREHAGLWTKPRYDHEQSADQTAVGDRNACSRSPMAMPTSPPMSVSIRCLPRSTTASTSRAAGSTPAVSARWASVLPAAMGVKLAFPDADVACVTGEGSIQMNIQELSTCTQYRIPVKIINLNNGYLGMVKQWQDMQYEGRYSHSTYEDSLPDFVKLVEAYGHVGIRVDKKEDLEAAMKEAFALKDRLVFLDIHVDPHEHVYPMLIAPNGSMRDMWLSKTERT